MVTLTVILIVIGMGLTLMAGVDHRKKNYASACLWTMLAMISFFLLTAVGFFKGRGYPAPEDEMTNNAIYERLGNQVKEKNDDGTFTYLVLLKDQQGQIRFWQMRAQPLPLFQVKTEGGVMRFDPFPSLETWDSMRERDKATDIPPMGMGPRPPLSKTAPQK